MFSSRVSASRGRLAWMVPSEPSWPVFIACSMSIASAPRISPRMMRSGRMRSAFLTRSRMVISPLPSRLGGRVSSRTTCGCCSCSSAASSMVTMRSPLSIICDIALSSVVLPEPVPPEMRMLSRDARGDLEHRRHRRRDVALPRHDVERDALLGEFADRDRGAVDRQRRHDDVDAAAVREARVDERRRFVDAAADLRHDARRDAHDVGVVAEGDVGQLELAACARHRPASAR